MEGEGGTVHDGFEVVWDQGQEAWEDGEAQQVLPVMGWEKQDDLEVTVLVEEEWGGLEVEDVVGGEVEVSGDQLKANLLQRKN